MKNVTLAFVVLLISAGWGCEAKIEHPGEFMALQGCLMNENGHYTLKQDSGIGYELVSQNIDLKAQVGHEILVRGSEVASGSAPGAPAMASQGVRNELEVTNVKSVADQCSASK